MAPEKTKDHVTPTIMVVNDSKDLSFMLSEALRSHIGCRVTRVKDCSKGFFDMVKEEAPDVILLDLNMRETDVFEVCTNLKQDKETSHIPIILLATDANDMRTKVSGLEAYADDYLIQPVDTVELITRVKVMLRMKRLIDSNARIADSGPRLSAKMAHSLRSPLNSIIGMAELIQKPYYGPLTEKQKGFAQIISNSGHELLKLINELGEG